MQHGLYFVMDSNAIGHIISYGYEEKIIKDGKSKKKIDIILKDLEWVYIKSNNICFLFLRMSNQPKFTD